MTKSEIEHRCQTPNPEFTYKLNPSEAARNSRKTNVEREIKSTKLYKGNKHTMHRKTWGQTSLKGGRWNYTY